MKRIIALLFTALVLAVLCAAQTDPGYNGRGSFREEGIASWYGAEFAGLAARRPQIHALQVGMIGEWDGGADKQPNRYGPGTAGQRTERYSHGAAGCRAAGYVSPSAVRV